MSDYNVLDLFEELRNDASWCEDEAARKASVDGLVYFFIEQ